MQEDALGEAASTPEDVGTHEPSIKAAPAHLPPAESPPRPRTDDPSTVLETYEASDDEPAVEQIKLQDLSADIKGIHLNAFHGKSSMRHFANSAYRVRSRAGNYPSPVIPPAPCALMRPVRQVRH